MKAINNFYYASSRISGFYFRVFSSAKGIRKIYINQKNQKQASANSIKLRQDDPFMFNIFRQLEEYFSNSRKVFDIPLDIDGTPFRKNVWKEISKIPFGKTSTYKQIALSVADIYSVRAVGGAVGANPVPIIIPCHRVIGVNGNLYGYSAGLKIKERLLELEGLISLELFDQ